MNPSPAPASAPASHFNIADCFTKPLSISYHRFTTTAIISDIYHPPTTSNATAPTVDTASVASSSDSVPLLHPNLVLAPTLPIVLDTGASYSIVPFASDFTPYGLVRTSTSAASKVASIPVDPHTLITREDAIALDLLSPDPTDTLDSDSGSCFDLLSVSALASHLQSSRQSHLEVFGTAALTFVYSGFNTLVHIWGEPIDLDWIHWVPLPRLTPTESYFHLLGFDYIEAFAFLHLYPLWITLLYLSVSALFALIRS